MYPAAMIDLQSLSKHSSLFYSALLLPAIFSPSVLADLNNIVDTANFLLQPISSIPGFFPQPWECSGAAPAAQSVLQFHANWHCTNPDNQSGLPRLGARFFGFHKQFLQGYNYYLASVGSTPLVQVWEPSPGLPIPPTHGGRPSNTPCNWCTSLPNNFKTPGAGGTLDQYATLHALGIAILPWHNGNHGNIAAAGGTGGCGGGSPDMNCITRSPADPIFYRYHHTFDAVQDDWRTLQPSDIAIVLDRSGSMSLTTAGGGTRLAAAKDAADLFVNLLEDGSPHTVGMVSFATTASNPPDMPLTSVAGAPAALTAAMAGLVASGSTTIGGGLSRAQTLVNTGTNERKAILLLTDGQENSPPTIASVQNSLGDTHLCSVGFGTPGSLDGPRLQQLSEQQGGIYISTPDPLQLKKQFVVCFANIFDTFMGEDPFDTLPASEMVSPPTVHYSAGDQKIVFILSWTSSSPAAGLQLAITTPSGSILDLTAPGVKSKLGPTWHIVRVKTPYYGEVDGNWVARAVRPIRSYVNGFGSRSFVDFEEGVALIRSQIATLCTKPNSCRRILYFEDREEDASLFPERSVYSSALLELTGRGILGNITQPSNATEFARVAANLEGYDLLVYNSQFTQKDQPYDSALGKAVCQRNIRSIVSDNRSTQGAAAILRCAGATRGSGSNFTTISPTDSTLLSGPADLRSPRGVSSPSYDLLPISGTNSSVQATFKTGSTAVLAFGDKGVDEKYFITVLTRGPTRVKPVKYSNNTYTLEDLHPTFHIPSTHWPSCGYSSVNATVSITRPLYSLSKYFASASPKAGNQKGDTLSPRAAAAVALGDKLVTPNETVTFQLYDDGTHGDSTKDDHYWETTLPAGFTAYDGDYELHARFRLCKTSTCGKENCIVREAHQTVTVLAQIKSTSKWTITKTPTSDKRFQATVQITPADEKGTLLGPGWADHILVTVSGDVKVDLVDDYDGKGAYQIQATYTNGTSEKPVLNIGQFGRPKNALKIEL